MDEKRMEETGICGTGMQRWGSNESRCMVKSRCMTESRLWFGPAGRQRRTAAGFAVFLVLMWVCTLVSKTIYASGLPQVQAAAAEKKKIEHTVESDGIIRQGSDRAVHTLAGLRVEQISVRVGDTVEKGDLLFVLDTEDLADVIEQKELEAAKMEYQISDLQKNRRLAEEEKRRQEERAEEDLETAADAAGRGISRADTAWQEADRKLQSHLEDGVPVTSQEGRESAYREYEEWVQMGKDLEATVSGNQARKEEKEAALAALQESGSAEEIAKAQEELEKVREELRSVQAEYETYSSHPMQEPDFSAEDTAKKAWEAEKHSLEGSVREAGYGKEDALLAGEAGVRDAERNQEDAQKEPQADSTLEISRMELKKLKREIEKYMAIYEAGGRIVSEVSGTVTKIHVVAGERTADGAAVVCADHEVPYQFETLLGKEQKKYVNLGDAVTLKTAQGNAELKVDYIEEDGSGSYRAVIYLPEGEGELGMSGTMRRSDVSESFSCCIPINALHSESPGNRYYVYVLGQRDGILGKEYYAQLRYVEVLDQNELYAALAEGSLSGEEQVITGCDKEIANGAAVRYEEF